MMSTPDKVLVVEEAVARISEVLHGLGPDVQAAVLADLTAIWLCGFHGKGKQKLRDELMREHLAMVRRLVAANEKIAMDRMVSRGNPQ